MAFKRKCNVCDFIGLDYEYFIKNKNICDVCLSKRIDDKLKKKLETSLRFTLIRESCTEQTSLQQKR